MSDREPRLVCLTMTGERAVVALIGENLVILGPRDRPLELPLDPPLLPPLNPPPLPPLAASNTSRNRSVVMKRRRSPVQSLIIPHKYLCTYSGSVQL